MSLQLEKDVGEVLEMTAEEREKYFEDVPNQFCVALANKLLLRICDNVALPFPVRCRLAGIDSGGGILIDENIVGGYRVSICPNRIVVCCCFHKRVHERVWTIDQNDAREHCETYSPLLAQLSRGEIDDTEERILLDQLENALLRFHTMPADVDAKNCLCDVCKRRLRTVAEKELVNNNV